MADSTALVDFAGKLFEGLVIAESRKPGSVACSIAAANVDRYVICRTVDLFVLLDDVEDPAFKSGSLVDFVALDYEFDTAGLWLLKKLNKILCREKKNVAIRISLMDVLAYHALLQLPAVCTLWVEICEGFLMDVLVERLADVNSVKLILRAKSTVDISEHVYKIVSTSAVAEIHVSNSGRGLPRISERAENNLFLEKVFVRNCSKSGFMWRNVLFSTSDVDVSPIEKNLQWKRKYHVKTPSEVKCALEVAVLEAGDSLNSGMVIDLVKIVMNFIY